jgi:TetR/AcrR family transcriptional regulator, transcriptional repressor for nem operon
VSSTASTEDAILDCARTLIVRGGYNGFSYADIATAVGIRKPSIHYYFPAKEDLVRTLVHRYRLEAEAGLAETARRSPDPADRLRGYLGYWAACIADGTMPICVCALLASERPLLPESVAAEVEAHFRTLSAWLTDALGSPAEAELFMATAHGAMLSARACADPQLFTTITDSLIARIP